MNNTSELWITVTGIVLLAFLVPGGTLAKTDELVRVSLTPTTIEVTLQEPVFLELTIENGRNEEVNVDLGHGRKTNLLFSVLDEAGTRRTIPPFIQRGISRPGRISISPNTIYRQKLWLDEWYGFTTPGQYMFEMDLLGKITNVAGVSVPTALTGQVSVTVLAHDEEKLRVAYQQLAETVIHSKDWGTQDRAARALSYAVDPVAVPSLTQVLRHGELPVKFSAVMGLTRIANAEAIQVLRAEAKNHDPGTNADIALMLERIKSGAQKQWSGRTVRDESFVLGPEHDIK